MDTTHELSFEEAAKLTGMNLAEWKKRAKELKIPGYQSGKIKRSVLEKYFPIIETFEYDSHIIAISNQKGGEGKTTISIALGEALSKYARTLLVDWDPQANATQLFYKDLEYSIMDCLGYRGKPGIPIERIIVQIKENLDLVPSSLNLANFTTAFEREDFERLKDALLPIRSSYQYILIDCPPSLGLILENAFIACDYVLVPIQTRAFSVQGLKDLYDTIEKIQKKANPRLKLLGAVLNQYESQKALSGLSNAIRKYFPVLNTIIYRRESIPQSQAKMSLLSTYDSQTFQYFLDLANEIKEKIHVQEK